MKKNLTVILSTISFLIVDINNRNNNKILIAQNINDRNRNL